MEEIIEISETKVIIIEQDVQEETNQEAEKPKEEVKFRTQEEEWAASDAIPYPNFDKYQVLDWAQKWNDEIKSGGVQAPYHAIKDSFKHEHETNKITFQLERNNNIHDIEIKFFANGLIKFYSENTKNKVPFSFDHIEGKPKLHPHILTQANIDNNHNDYYSIKLEKYTILIFYKPFNIVFNSTLKGEHIMSMNNHQTFSVDPHLGIDFTYNTQYLFGIPERADHFLLHDTLQDRPYRLYNLDIFKFPLYAPSGLYGAIPAIFSHSPNQKLWSGVYWQNCSETYVHVNKPELTQSHPSTYWLSEIGHFEMYLWIDNDIRSFFKTSGDLLGYAAMPQYFSFGYHQCRYSYMTQEIAEDVIENFDKYHIPMDSLTLDIDHTDRIRYFTWHPVNYPDPLRLQNILNQEGRKLLTIADPHLAATTDYILTKKAKENDLLVKSADNKDFLASCWPGPTHWLDFLNPKGRALWASMYHKENYPYSTDILYAWNDMNEPSVFKEFEGTFPKTCLHTHVDPEGQAHQIEHRVIHNIYGFLQHKSTYQGLINRHSDKNDRPHILSRSFFAGSQKYCAIWTGDSCASWEYLKATPSMLLSISLLGLSFCGGDVGGFVGDPSSELALRWYQLGAFTPYFRGHAAKPSKRREPYLYEEDYRIKIKQAIHHRYRLLPLWYTIFEEHTRNCLPIMRPLWLNFESVQNEGLINEEHQFMINDILLINPILKEGVTVIDKPIRPELKDERWYNFFTLDEITNPDEPLNVGYHNIGVFIRGGHILPTFHLKKPYKSSLDARKADYELIIALDNKQHSHGSLYIDDGKSFNFKNGEFTRYEFIYDNGYFKATAVHDQYKVENRFYTIVLLGANQKYNIAKININDQENHAKIIHSASDNQIIELEIKLGFSFSVKFE